jgi:hypothetical protein
VAQDCTFEIRIKTRRTWLRLGRRAAETLVTEDRVHTKDLSHLDTRLSPRLMPTGVTKCTVWGCARHGDPSNVLRARLVQTPGAPMRHGSNIDLPCLTSFLDSCSGFDELLSSAWADNPDELRPWSQAERRTCHGCWPNSRGEPVSLAASNWALPRPSRPRHIKQPALLITW